MNLLADENIDHPIVLALRELGFDVLSISELHPAVPDEQVLELALTQERLLITSDKDFGELVFRQHRDHHGVLLLRLSSLSPLTIAATVSEFIQEHQDDLKNKYCVFTPGHVRIRPKILD